MLDLSSAVIIPRLKSSAHQTLRSIGIKLLLVIVAAMALLGLRAMSEWHSTYVISSEWTNQIRGRSNVWARAIANAAAGIQPPQERTFRSSDELRRALEGAMISAAEARQSSAPQNTPTETNRESQALESLQAALFARDSARSEMVAALDQLHAEFKREQTDGNGSQDKTSAMVAKRKRIEEWYGNRMPFLEERVAGSGAAFYSELDATVGAARSSPASDISPFLMAVGNPRDPMHMIYEGFWYFLQVLAVFSIALVIVSWMLVWSRSTDTSGVFDRTWSFFASAFSSGGWVQKGAAALIASSAIGLGAAGVSAAMESNPDGVVHSDPAPIVDRRVVEDLGASGKDEQSTEVVNQIARFKNDLEVLQKSNESHAEVIERLARIAERPEPSADTISGIDERTKLLNSKIDNLSGHPATMLTKTGELKNLIELLGDDVSTLSEGVDTVDSNVNDARRSIEDALFRGKNDVLDRFQLAENSVRNDAKVLEGDILQQSLLSREDGLFRSLLLRRYQSGPLAAKALGYRLGDANPGLLNALAELSDRPRTRREFKHDLYAKVSAKDKAALEQHLTTILGVCRLPR